jgi:TonB family protein
MHLPGVVLNCRIRARVLAITLSAGAPAAAQIGATTQAEPTPATPAATAAPRLTQFVQADYPVEALAQGLEGSVLLELTIDPTGHVTQVTVVQPLGHGFDEAAMAAARNFVFEPARRDGVVVASILRYRYRFSAAAARAAQQPRVRALIRATVRGRGDQPLAGVAVTVTLPDGTTRQATSDERGALRFELDAVGSVRLALRAEGYEPIEVSETVADREDLGLTYRLSPVRPVVAPAAPTPGASSAAEPEDEATVRARRPPREVTRQSLEFREILRMPGTGGDALRAVQNFPGVARAINGLLIVRGSTPQDTQIFADGTSIPIVYHFGGLSSVVSTELLDRIDFYPGNYSARYGRAQGGIVDVGLRSPRRQGYRFVANINLIDASLFFEGAITRNLSFAVSVRRSYVDAILGAVLSGIDSVSFTSLPVYWDYQALLEYRPSPRDRVRLALLGSDDSLSLLLNRPSEVAPRFSGSFSTGIGFHAGQLLWDHTFSPTLSSRAMFSVNRNSINVGGGEVFGLDLNFWNITGRYELTAQIDRHVRANVGLDLTGGPAEIRFNGIRQPSEGQQPNLQNLARVSTQSADSIYRPGAYAEFEITPTSRLRLIPSLRADYTRDANRSWAVQPRFSFRWEFLRDWFLKGGVGVFNQPPQPQQSSGAANSFNPSTTVGNPFLATQRSVHYGLGMEHNFSRYLSLSVEGFYKDLDQQIVAQPSIQGAAYLNSGIGRIYGGEILFRHRPSARFFGWLAYTISRSERRDSPESAYRIFQFDQTHILTLIGSYRLGRGWELGLRFRFVTGNPTTPIIGAVYNGDTGTYTQIPGAAYSARNAPFHQLDLRVDKTWTFRRGSLNLFLEVLNVYNNANPEGVQYNYNYTQSTTVTGIPFFPNLGFRYEY